MDKHNTALTDLMPLTLPQLEVWMAQTIYADLPIYNLGAYIPIQAKIDPKRFEQSVVSLVQRHDALRIMLTQPNTDDGLPRQYIKSSFPVPFKIWDFSKKKNPHHFAQNWMRQRCDEPFRLYESPLFRFDLIKISDNCWYFFNRYHHIIMDGESHPLIYQALAKLYTQSDAESSGQDIYSYTAYIQDDLAYRTSERYTRDTAYWREQCVTPSELLLQPRHSLLTQVPLANAIETLTLPREKYQALLALAERLGTTFLSLIASVLYVYFNRTSQKNALTIALAVHNRSYTKFKKTGGLFAKILPLWLDFDIELHFDELVQKTHCQIKEHLRHHRYPATQRINKQNRTLFSAGFDVSLSYMTVDRGINFSGNPTQPIPIQQDYRLTPLGVQIYAPPVAGDIEIECTYNQAYFSEQDIQLLVRRFDILLESVMTEPSSKINVLALWNDEERKMVLQTWNATARPYPKNLCVHQMFEAQVKVRPDSTAVVFGDRQLSYHELNRKANRVAHSLIESGVSPGVLVGLCCERSLDMLIGLLGILKAGGAYVPIDPSYPETRVRYLLEDSGIRLLLTQTPLLETLPQLQGMERRCLDTFGTDHWSGNKTNPPPKAGMEHLAYVIYTSGSTGQPKGVMITHQNVAALVAWSIDEFRPDSFAGTLASTSITFDLSVFECLVPICCGGSVVIIANILHLPHLTSKHPITFINTVPSGINELIRVQGIPSSVKIVGLAGEPLRKTSVDALYQLGHIDRVYNLYGPTEDTTYSTYSAIGREETSEPTIGRPIANTEVYVLDAYRLPTPIGIPGELYIGGAGLAQGYLNRPELTAERFVELEVFGERKRLYRTGDRVSWRADGNLLFLGRLDHQIKLRGYRIEPGEIEAVLREHPQVAEALVVLNGEGDDKRLDGYVVAKPELDAAPTATRLEHWHTLYEATYDGITIPSDFDITGWNSSYTDEALPAGEMAIWVDETVERIRRLSGRRMLEIGCGTGLLLTRLASASERYIGLDFSETVLERLSATLAARPDLSHVEIHRGPAHELEFLPSGSMDVVILNSVVQYFPDLDYLLAVLEQVQRVCVPNGRIFLGDLRNLNLQEAYHASVVLHRADDNELMDRVQSRYRQVIQNDEELLLAPEFFDALARHWPGVARAEVRLKAGNYDNELSRFRYDVVLVLGERQQLAPVAFWHDWDAEGRWRDSVMRRMTSYPAEAQGVRDLPDIRVSEAVAAWREMESDKTRYQTVKEIRQVLQKHGENPDTLFALAKWLGVDLIWQTLGGDGRYQAVFNPVWTVEKEREILPRADYHRYANNPARRERQVALSHELKATLTRQLPKYMVPNAILVLDAFPLTPNGKIDRNRLPDPKVNNYGVQDYVAPRNSLEKSLVSIWQEALTLSEPPSVTDNFFELGGHSLLSAKVVTLIEEKLGYRISLKQFFQQPTIEAMALSMEQQTSDKDSSEEHGGIRWPLPKALQYKLESYVCSWGGKRASTESLIFAHHVKGTLPPLFWVFQGDQEFAQLAKYLGDSQPLYGMRSGHLIMDYQEDDIQAFALRYVTEIERLYPTGPLFVGGNCQGGVIALAIAQHLLRRQRILPLAFVMEWSFGTQPYLGSVAFLYGQDSVFNPYLNFQHPHLFWQRSFPDHRIEMIPGAHGKFFVEPNIQGLSSTISRCMAEAIKNSPLFIPTSDRKAEITVLNLPNTFMSGGHYLLAVKLRNASTINWNRTDISGLMLGNQWLNTENQFISRQDGKTPIPSLLAGQSTQLYLPIKAPEQAGLVHLNLSLIEEGVCWFKGADQGEIQFKINLIAPEAYTLPTFSSDITRHGAPILIGGTGGSGITVIAKVLAEAGIFLGEQTGSSDSTSMMENWSSSLLPYWNKPLPCSMEAIIRKDLEETVNNFLTTRDAEKTSLGWGWKLTPHVFFLPFLHQIWPNLRCIHIVRDGRDMALSSNQKQLNYLGPIALSSDELILPSEQRSILLWERLNLSLADYAAKNLPNQYLCLNYEDLCNSPHTSINRLFSFLDIKEDNTAYAAQIKPSSGVGRWKQQPENIKNTLASLGEKALNYFGYTLPKQ